MKKRGGGNGTWAQVTLLITSLGAHMGPSVKDLGGGGEELFRGVGWGGVV